jgi:hypothetical protein
MKNNPGDLQGLREIECTVVLLVTAGISPAILNGDFLKQQETIPREWEIAPQPPPITSPGASSIAFSSGVAILALPDRLQVSDHLSAGDPAQSPAAEIAKKLVGVFPYARYSAAGINFRAFMERPDGLGFLKSRFLKEGPWLDPHRHLGGAGVRFSYSVEAARMNLQLEDGELSKKGGEKVNGIAIACNFHSEIKDYPARDRVDELLDRFGAHWKLYLETRFELLAAERS